MWIFDQIRTVVNRETKWREDERASQEADLNDIKWERWKRSRREMQKSETKVEEERKDWNSGFVFFFFVFFFFFQVRRAFVRRFCVTFLQKKKERFEIFYCQHPKLVREGHNDRLCVRTTKKYFKKRCEENTKSTYIS